jgi:hypothetical protein
MTHGGVHREAMHTPFANNAVAASCAQEGKLAHLTGDESQIWRLGVCLLITNVPFSPSLMVSTPICRMARAVRVGQPLSHRSLSSDPHER